MKDEPRYPGQKLFTATAIADPVLVRIDARRGRIVLLAEDATYDSAGLIRLHSTRCMYMPRAMRRLLKGERTTEYYYDEVHLRRTGNYYVAVAQGRVVAPPAERPFPMKNLSAAEYGVLLNATPRRLRQAGEALVARPRRAKRSVTSRMLQMAASAQRFIAARAIS